MIAAMSDARTEELKRITDELIAYLSDTLRERGWNAPQAQDEARETARPADDAQDLDDREVAKPQGHAFSRSVIERADKLDEGAGDPSPRDSSETRPFWAQPIVAFLAFGLLSLIAVDSVWSLVDRFRGGAAAEETVAATGPVTASPAEFADICAWAEAREAEISALVPAGDEALCEGLEGEELATCEARNAVPESLLDTLEACSPPAPTGE